MSIEHKQSANIGEPPILLQAYTDFLRNRLKQQLRPHMEAALLAAVEDALKDMKVAIQTRYRYEKDQLVVQLVDENGTVVVKTP
jgi:hypothetical protein